MMHRRRIRGLNGNGGFRFVPAASVALLALAWPGLAAAQRSEPADAALLDEARAVARDASAPIASRREEQPVPAAFGALPANLPRVGAIEQGEDGKGRGAAAPSKDSPGLLLPPKSGTARRSASPGGTSSRAAAASHLPPLMTVVGSTCLVLSLFFVVAWLLKRGMPRSMHALPSEVFEVLGRSLLAKGQYIHLVRCGGKLLLVTVSPAGAETLTEIADPIEVDRLTGLCKEQHPASATASFRQALAQFAPEPAPAPLSAAGQPAARTPAAAGRGARALTGEERRA